MSFRMQIDPKSRKAARFISGVHKQLQAAYVRASKRGINQQTLASALNVDRSTVNKRLLGVSNLTLRSISDLAWAMGENVRLVVEPSSTEGRNFCVPVAVHTGGGPVTTPKLPQTFTTSATFARDREILVTDEHV